jgi:hypothetical protein
MTSTKKLAVCIIIPKPIELRLNFTVAIHIIHVSPVTKKKGVTLHRFGRRINSIKKQSCADLAELNFPSMNIYPATRCALLVKVHLTPAVAPISIYILSVNSAMTKPLWRNERRSPLNIEKSR